jgi:hypothetical protein
MALLLGVVTFCVSGAISLSRWPVPSIHDEFSYLLAADTFTQGRLANPTHPYWQHFETFHVIQEPTYASKYPPGQGLVLAVGQWLTGKPIVGIWILSAISAAACYWMLIGWVSTRWAAVGGLLFLLHPGYIITWGQSYWGGTLAFLGGALVFGAAARMQHRPQVHDAIAMSVGAMLLAISRPYEGLAFSVIVGTVVLVYWWRQGPPTWSVLIQQAILPQIVIFLIGGSCLAYYNHAVTGNWRTMPYQVHESTYAMSPCFLWNPPYENREYRHTVFSEFHHGWEINTYHEQRSIADILQKKIQVFKTDWNYFFPLPLMLSLVFVPFCHTQHKWTIMAVVGAAWTPSLLTVWNFPHYLAPMAPTLMILVLMGLRQANTFGKKYLNLHHLATLLIVWQFVSFTASAINYHNTPKDRWQWQRTAILQQLENSPQRHLVFVHYDPGHNTHNEWVYNRARIDQAQVVWAREMGESLDRALLEYFQDRKAWILDADAPHPHLQPIIRQSNIVQAQPK